MLRTQLFSLIFLQIFVLSPVSAETNWDNVVGTTLGSVVGGVIGYQFGGGTGKYVATAAGAVIGGALGNKVAGGDGFDFRDSEQPEATEYAYTSDGQTVYVGEDDYLIKQQLSNDAKYRNRVRNGEVAALEVDELPYDVSNTQTSWDDPDN